MAHVPVAIALVRPQPHKASGLPHAQRLPCLSSLVEDEASSSVPIHCEHNSHGVVKRGNENVMPLGSLTELALARGLGE